MRIVCSILGLLLFVAGCASTPPNVSVKPSGETWHCTSHNTANCFREQERCDAVTAEVDKNRGIYKCRTQPEAWCYTWVKNDKPEFACLNDAKSCEHNRELRMILARGEAHRGARYAEWSGCGAW